MAVCSPTTHTVVVVSVSGKHYPDSKRINQMGRKTVDYNQEYISNMSKANLTKHISKSPTTINSVPNTSQSHFPNHPPLLYCGAHRDSFLQNTKWVLAVSAALCWNFCFISLFLEKMVMNLKDMVKCPK